MTPELEEREAPDTLEDDLIAAMAPDTVPIDPDEGQAPDELAEWVAQSLDEAAWATRKLARRRAQLAEVAAYADRQRAILDEWEAKQGEKFDRDCAFFEDRLQQFHRRVLAQDPKAMTIKLPGAQLHSRKGSTRVEVTDADAFAKWCETYDHTDLLRYKDPDVDKRAVAEQFGAKVEDAPGDYPVVDPDTGEIAPGITFERGERTFTVALED